MRSKRSAFLAANSSSGGPVAIDAMSDEDSISRLSARLVETVAMQRADRERAELEEAGDVVDGELVEDDG